MQDSDVWVPLAGGRTNPIWRIETAQGAVVCKLFRSNAATPLFPNDPTAEAIALNALEGTSLAPRLIATGATNAGDSLVYSYVPGAPWRAGVTPVARLLSQLHKRPLPNGLARAETGAVALLAQGQMMLDDIGTQGRALQGLKPAPVQMPAIAPVFLHGDVVPGNLLQGDKGLTLIDWQCPCVGDPCDDLAVFLSPAMQSIYGETPLSSEDEQAFLSAYDAPEIVRRYRALAPIYNWRMATFCLWKAARGDPDYAQAAKHEIARLKQR